MSQDKPPIGSVTWFDLTVEKADDIRDFYSEVVGWQPSAVPMGDYEDYSMNSPTTGDPMTGVCYARGGNAHLPPVWMIYVNVENLDSSLQKVTDLGGKLISDIRTMQGYGRYCAIQDPAGAILTLFEPV